MKSVVVIFACVALAAACTKPVEKEAAPVVASKPAQTEIGDQKYVEMGKTALASLNAGDVDAYIALFSDQARFYWSSGDSLIGKPAIAKFWKERFTAIVDSVNFYNDIWTPLKVNVSQRGPDVPGVWLLCWYQVRVKYKNGQQLNYWVHTDFHYNTDDKVDFAMLYMDRAPIVAALAKK